MTNVRDLIWPYIEKQTKEALEQQLDDDKRDIAAIRSVDWSNNCDVALDEARRLFDTEAERRRGAESKAGMYLAAIAALAPILASFVGARGGDFTFAHKLVDLSLSILAVLYLSMAGLWAFRALAVTTTHRVDAADLAQMWLVPSSAKARLIRDTLISVRMNRNPVNKKLTNMKLAHAFLLRSLIAFCALTLVSIGWSPVVETLSMIGDGVTSYGGWLLRKWISLLHC